MGNFILIIRKNKKTPVREKPTELAQGNQALYLAEIFNHNNGYANQNKISKMC